MNESWYQAEKRPSGGALRQAGAPYVEPILYEPVRYESQSEQQEVGIDLWEILRVVTRWKWVIVGTAVSGLSLAYVLSLLETPKFKAVTMIEVQKQEARIIEGGQVGPEVVADQDFMLTQYELIKSRALAERVVDELALSSNELFADQTLPTQERFNEAVETLLGDLRVAPRGRSRVVNVEYISPDARLAALVVNSIVDNFIESNLERKYNTTAFARQFVEERLSTTKEILEDSERKLVAYATEQGILDIGSGSLDADSLISLNAELSQAESKRIIAEQRYREAINNPNTTQVLESQDMRRLRASQSDLVAEYQENLRTFRPEYPDMMRLQSRIDALDREMQATRNAIVSSLEAEYRAALASETSLRARVDSLRGDLQDLRDRRIEYTILQREVDTNRTQYEALLQRMKEISTASGIGSSQIAVVDRAFVPQKPFEPNIPRVMLLALVLSLGAGIGIAFLLNYVDDTIKTPDDVKTKLGLPTIGVVPKLASPGEDAVVQALADPKSPISEAFFAARTALQFTTPEGAPKSLLVTSTRPGEGKTSTSVSLATAFAKVGRRVLIIDGDMRRPSFVADAGASVGLSGLLTQPGSVMDNVVSSSTPGLYLLPSGIIPPNPAELLSGPRLREILTEAEREFDVVVIDSPPVLSFADSPIYGHLSRGCIVVIEAGSIRRPAAVRTISRMVESNSHVLGVILTKFDAKRAGYDYGSYYYAYGKGAYAYGEQQVRDSARVRRKISLFKDAGTPSDTTPPASS